MMSDPRLDESFIDNKKVVFGQRKLALLMWKQKQQGS